MAFGNMRLPFYERPDLTPFLVHFTKRSNGCDALDNLKSILKAGVIRGSDNNGYIKGDIPATCFMDVPFSSLKYILRDSNTNSNSPQYEPYGIVVGKDHAFLNGARPVWYLSDKDIVEIDIQPDQKWRVARLEGMEETSIGWLHEREWRAKGNFRLPEKLEVVLVWDGDDAKNLTLAISKNPSIYKTQPLSILSLKVLCQGYL